jgi:hypothetical protein
MEFDFILCPLPVVGRLVVPLHLNRVVCFGADLTNREVTKLAGCLEAKRNL